MQDIKQLLIDKLDTANILKQNHILFFEGEIKAILKYIQDLENNK